MAEFYLPDHYEFSVGKIESGWSDDNSNYNIQIIKLKNSNEEKEVTLATLGMSDYLLNLPDGRQLRQELIISMYDDYDNEDIAKSILSISESACCNGKALIRGQVLTDSIAVTPGFRLNSLYVTNPSPLGDKILSHGQSDLVFAYLIPIAAEEARLIESKGWRYFEDQLEDGNIDIFDLKRDLVI